MLNIKFRYLIFRVKIAHIKYIKGVISNIRRFGFTGHIGKVISNIWRFGFYGNRYIRSHCKY